MLAGYVVQKIFYFVIGTLIYIYLFSEIAGSFDFQFGNEWDAVSSHVVLTLGIIAGGIFLVALLLRIFGAGSKCSGQRPGRAQRSWATSART